jgi:hypothetical protein
MINHRLRKAVLAGASIDVINAMSFDFNYRTNSENIVAPDRTVVTFNALLTKPRTANSNALSHSTAFHCPSTLICGLSNLFSCAKPS